jgi:hypothetical protein
VGERGCTGRSRLPLIDAVRRRGRSEGENAKCW